MKKLISLILVLTLTAALAIGLSSCKGDYDEKEGMVYAEMKVSGYGKIYLELDPAAAPKTVENFVKLVNEGFYNGLTFHRVMEGFMIQGGDPKADGTGGSSQTIVGEFSSNGYSNPISHVRGVISMARSNEPNSASSQFFICNADATFLDGNYAAFGRVVDGMDVVDQITAKTLPYTPYYEYYGTETYEMLSAYGYLSGAISDKSKQAVIDYVKIVDSN